MSAVPKKKLCWNCDGNVTLDNNNCPYCGVYLLATEEAEQNRWDPSHQSSDRQDEEAPTPLYQVQQQEETETEKSSETTSIASSELIRTLKHDLGPILLLMAGSIFFLFGIILLLFSHNGLLTLQWDGSNWIYFLGLSVPLIYLGWKLVKDLENG